MSPTSLFACALAFSAVSSFTFALASLTFALSSLVRIELTLGARPPGGGGTGTLVVVRRAPGLILAMVSPEGDSRLALLDVSVQLLSSSLLPYFL